MIGTKVPLLPKIEPVEDDKPLKPKNFYGSQDPRGDIDHVDQVIHIIFIICVYYSTHHY